MGVSERNKGKSGERELGRLLGERLGYDVTRNLDQSRDGGCDLIGVGAFALEVKRQEKLALVSWWAQACEQAARAGLIPCLAYRQSRRPWRFILPLGVLMSEALDYQAIATLELEGFVLAARMLAPVMR